MVNKATKVAKLQKQLAKLNASPEQVKADTKARFLKFFADKKIDVSVVREGFSVSLPVKAGLKDYDALQLSNGKTYVYTMANNVLKSAWN